MSEKEDELAQRAVLAAVSAISDVVRDHSFHCAQCRANFDLNIVALIAASTLAVVANPARFIAETSQRLAKLVADKACRMKNVKATFECVAVQLNERGSTLQ